MLFIHSLFVVVLFVLPFIRWEFVRVGVFVRSPFVLRVLVSSNIVVTLIFVIHSHSMFVILLFCSFCSGGICSFFGRSFVVLFAGSFRSCVRLFSFVVRCFFVIQPFVISMFFCLFSKFPFLLYYFLCSLMFFCVLSVSFSFRLVFVSDWVGNRWYCVHSFFLYVLMFCSFVVPIVHYIDAVIVFDVNYTFVVIHSTVLLINVFINFIVVVVINYTNYSFRCGVLLLLLNRTLVHWCVLLFV